MIEKEKIEMSDPVLPIKTYIVNSNSRNLAADPHMHDEVELIYIMVGEMNFQVGSHRLKVDNGKIIFINSMTVHSSETTPGVFTKMCLLQFNPGLVYNKNCSEYKYLTPFIQHNSFYYHMFDINDSSIYNLLAPLLTEIACEFQNKNIAYEILINSNLYKILTILYRSNVLKFNPLNSLRKEESILAKLDKVIKYVENNYYENITLETASSMLNLNYHYFCRLFRTATGKPFIQYLNFVRVSAAERLLLSTDKPIIDIICDTGFSSLSYFNKIFKKMKGISPKKYRKKFTKS